MSNTKYFDIEDGRCNLEFSDRDAVFHYNEGHARPNTNSYVTVLENVSLEEAESFVDNLPLKVEAFSLKFLLKRAKELNSQ